MMQRDFEAGRGEVGGDEGRVRMRERDGNQKDFHKKKSGINKVPEIQQFGFTYIIHLYLFGIFYSADTRGEPRDKLNMTCALQAQPERADACKNTQGAEKRLRG